MTCQYPDLVVLFFLVEANFEPIRPTTQIWVEKGHQYGIFVLISQTSFHRETSCDLVKCWLFSQAVIRKGGNDCMNIFLTVCITSILLCTVEPCLMATSVTQSPHYYGHFFWGGGGGGYTFPYTKNPINVVTH